jgi:hypothetical protein
VSRRVDRALFLVGETTLTAAEVLRWAAELGYPARAEDQAEQLVVARADAAEGWRS